MQSPCLPQLSRCNGHLDPESSVIFSYVALKSRVGYPSEQLLISETDLWNSAGYKKFISVAIALKERQEEGFKDQGKENKNERCLFVSTLGSLRAFSITLETPTIFLRWNLLVILLFIQKNTSPSSCWTPWFSSFLVDNHLNYATDKSIIRRPAVSVHIMKPWTEHLQEEKAQQHHICRNLIMYQSWVFLGYQSLALIY